MLNIILWIVFGAIVGVIVDYLDKSVALGWIERIVLGIVGAVLGGTVFHVLSTGDFNLTAAVGFDLLSFIIAILGAFVAMFVYKTWRARA